MSLCSFVARIWQWGVSSGRLKVTSCSRKFFVIETDVQDPARSEATLLKAVKEGTEGTVANL